MELAQRLRTIRARIDAAAESVDRDPGSVTLIAVSKNHPIEAIQAAYDLGLRDFGESRLQEAQPKIEALPGDIVWHFIGRLQSNKARKIGGLFQSIHTLDKESQLLELSKCEGIRDGLIEVNIADEPQKSGIPVKMLDDFHQYVLKCRTIHYRGLMTIGPANGDAEQMRGYFRRLRTLNQEAGGEWLSMGMSDDFEVAIQEGSTHVRIGTALFGERQY